MASIKIHRGDCREILRTLSDQSINCCVTSPPYWGLRDYGIENQLGLEATPEEYVTRLVEVFREVHRILRNDGTLWLNLGDSYACRYERRVAPSGLKPKDLVGIPWRVAFALQADGWYLRSDIIWHKPNPMPESITDRPTKAHEYLFLLSKNEQYFYDAGAIQEPAVDAPGVSRGGSLSRFGRDEKLISQNAHRGNKTIASNGFRNKRSVWTISTEPYPYAHFATFPPALIEPCIKAACPIGGTVLDPFAGSGTTAQVARALGCHAVLIELNEAYCLLTEKRISQQVLNFFTQPNF